MALRSRNFRGPIDEPIKAVADMAQRTCSIEDCDRLVDRKGWCSAHYTRWKRHGDPLSGGASRGPVRECSVEGCASKAICRGWCGKHYARWNVTGSPLLTCEGCEQGYDGGKRQRYCSDDCKPRCAVDGCGQPIRKHRWCASHYTQWYDTGEVAPFRFKWGSGGYASTHGWLYRQLGSPSGRPCVDCGRRAAEWSYVGDAPTEQVSPQGTYARDIDYYEPRCVRCHRLYDDNPIATRGGAIP